MSRQIELTLQGVVGTTPMLIEREGKRPYCYFRVASTPAFRGPNGWEEQETLWFTAKAWGALAQNLAYSLSKGEPVLLTGRLSQERWTRQSDGVQMTTNVLTLSAGGHDLSRGMSRYARVPTRTPQEAEGGASSSEAAEAREASCPDVDGGAAGIEDAAAGPGPADAPGATGVRIPLPEGAAISVSAKGSLPDSHWEVDPDTGEVLDVPDHRCPDGASSGDEEGVPYEVVTDSVCAGSSTPYPRGE